MKFTVTMKPLSVMMSEQEETTPLPETCRRQSQTSSVDDGDDFWYEWYNRYEQGPDAHLIPTVDAELPVNVRKYRREHGDGEVKEAMKERRIMSEYDQDESDRDNLKRTLTEAASKVDKEIEDMMRSKAEARVRQTSMTEEGSVLHAQKLHGQQSIQPENIRYTGTQNTPNNKHVAISKIQSMLSLVKRQPNQFSLTEKIQTNWISSVCFENSDATVSDNEHIVCRSDNDQDGECTLILAYVERTDQFLCGSPAPPPDTDFPQTDQSKTLTKLDIIIEDENENVTKATTERSRRLGVAHPIFEKDKRPKMADLVTSFVKQNKVEKALQSANKSISLEAKTDTVQVNNIENNASSTACDSSESKQSTDALLKPPPSRSRSTSVPDIGVRIVRRKSGEPRPRRLSSPQVIHHEEPKSDDYVAQHLKFLLFGDSFLDKLSLTKFERMSMEYQYVITFCVSLVAGSILALVLRFGMKLFLEW